VSNWDDYQEEVAEFFISLGLSAATNVRIDGVRTRHEVDVVVRSKHAGFDVLWLVECKCWKAAIPKDKVLTLRSIMDDTGADRGFIMAENGYQSGAFEASRFTNVTLASLTDLKSTLAYDVGMAKLRSIPGRVESCRERYWAIDKADRIDLDLRPDILASGYMGDAVIKAVGYTVQQALHYGFPIVYDRMTAALSAMGGGGADLAGTVAEGASPGPSELYDVLDAELRVLEGRLDAAEDVLRSRVVAVEGDLEKPAGPSAGP
jgi:hypothetical protein